MIRPEQVEAPISQMSQMSQISQISQISLPFRAVVTDLLSGAVVAGGLVRNLGADIIIAVNVGSLLLEEREITSAVGVANQMLRILTNQNVTHSLKELEPDDILIDPDLGNIALIDFARHQEAIASVQRAACPWPAWRFAAPSAAMPIQPQCLAK